MRHKPATVYGGKVGAKPAKKRTTISKRVTKTPYVCMGGPMDGHILYLESNDTLIFTMNGQTGQYLGGMWKCV